MDRFEKLIAGASGVILLLIVLINLAWMALLGWGIFELVTWVTSK